MAAALRNNNHENEVDQDGGGEVRIDIPAAEGGAVLDHSRWARREAVDRRRRLSRFERRSRQIIGTTLALGGQAIGAVVAVALTSATSSWPVHSVELCILFGLSFIFAALALRREHPQLSAAMAKVGAVATALAIVIAVTSHLPPFLALAAGTFTFLIISAAVALAS